MPDLKVLDCIVCEDVRPEQSGKATLIGYVGTLPYAEIWLRDMKLPVQQLCFIFLAEKGEGDFVFEPQLISPDGLNLIPGSPVRNLITLSRVGRTNITIQLLGIVFPKAGTYLLQATANGKQVYEEPFEIIEGPPASDVVGQAQALAPTGGCGF